MTVLGWLMIHALFVAAGGGLLAALGMVRPTARGALWALGPSYLTGVALVVLPLIVLGVAGVTVSLLTILVVGLLEAGGLLAYTVLRGDPGRATLPAVLGALRAERVLIAVLAVGLVGYLLFAGAALTDVPVGWDAAHMWELKALALYHFDGQGHHLRAQVRGQKVNAWIIPGGRQHHAFRNAKLHLARSQIRDDNGHASNQCRRLISRFDTGEDLA